MTLELSEIAGDMPAVKHDVQEEIERVTAALRTAIRLSGVSRRHIERELCLSTGYLTRILAGQVQLRVSHLLGICRVIGFSAGSFFSSLFPPTPPQTVAEARLARGLGSLHPEPKQTSDPETLVQELHALLEQLAAIFKSGCKP